MILLGGKREMEKKGITTCLRPLDKNVFLDCVRSCSATVVICTL